MPFVNAPATPAAPVAPPAPRDILAVTAALGELDKAVAQSEQAAAIVVPKKGLFGGAKDAHDAALAERTKLLAPAATAIAGVIEVLNANGGYRSQRAGSYGDPVDGGYRAPYVPLGDNAHDIVSISKTAAANPLKFKWVNDFPWQSQPTTTLEELVGLVTDAAGTITRGEAMISLRKVTNLTEKLLYAQRVDQLDASQLQQLQDAVIAVRSLGDSRFADDTLRGALAVLPAQVLVDGKLTTDAASLAALEQLHRTTVVDAGSAKVAANVATQVERAKSLAAAGDTAGAREIYEQLAAAGATAVVAASTDSAVVEPGA